MCEPTTIMMAISAVSAGVSYIGGQQQADNAQTASNNAAQLEYQQINEKQQQINQQSALDQSERNKQGLLEQAKISTIAGESGALGISSDRLMLDSFMQEGTDMASLEKNRVNAIKQTGWEGKQAQGSAGVRNASIAGSRPNLIGTGLQIAGEAYIGNEKAKAIAKAGKP